MAHFARINENNIVTEVLVVPDEQEARGQEYLANDLGLGGIWMQTSYNRKIRKNYAGIGYLYNHELDMFIAPQPHLSWILNNDTGEWISPIPYPNDGKKYQWSEENMKWNEVK